MRLSTAALALLTLALSAVAPPARAGSISVDLGPGSVGTGGSNPLGLPPGPTDISVRWVTANNYDWTFSLVPGILFGKRFQQNGWYASFGGGLLIDANGVGVGPYLSLGYIFDGNGPGFHFHLDYTQTVGGTAAGFVAPAAGRMGVLWAY